MMATTPDWHGDKQDSQWENEKYMLDPFNALIYEISEDITDDELRQLKRAYEALPSKLRPSRRSLQKIEHPYDLIKGLQNRGIIDEGNTDVLQDLLRVVGLSTQVNRIEQYHQEIVLRRLGFRNRGKSSLISSLRESLRHTYINNMHHLALTGKSTSVREDARILDCGNRQSNYINKLRTKLMKRRQAGLTIKGTKLAYDWATGKHEKYTLAFHVHAKLLSDDCDLIDAVYDQLLPENIGVSKDELLQHIADTGKPILYIIDGIDNDGCKLKTGSTICNAIPSTILPLCEVRATEHKFNEVTIFKKFNEVNIRTDVFPNYPSQIDEMINVLKDIYLKFKKTFIGSVYAQQWAYGASSEYFLVFHIDTYQMEVYDDLMDAVFHQLLPTYTNMKDELLWGIRHQDKPVLFILDGFGEELSAIQDESNVVGVAPCEILEKCKFLGVTSFK